MTFFCSSWFQGLRWVPMTMYCKKLTSKYLLVLWGWPDFDCEGKYGFSVPRIRYILLNTCILHKYLQTFLIKEFLEFHLLWDIFLRYTNFLHILQICTWIHDIFCYLPNENFIEYVCRQQTFWKKSPNFLWRCYLCKFK